MDFENFLNEKLADDLTPDQLDRYWKTISAYNQWKRNKKNSRDVKNKLAFIKHEFPLDSRALAKIQSLIDTIDTYMETGEDTTVIRSRNTTRPIDEKPVETVEIDTNDYQKIELSNDFLSDAFDKFNAKYFDNKLAKIKVTLDDDMKGNVGEFVYSIDFSNKTFKPFGIKVDKYCQTSFAEFRNTLVHEMLHYYVHCYTEIPEENWEEAYFYACRGNKRKYKSLLGCSDATCHSGVWLKMAKQLNSKFKELAITRNVFINYKAEEDKISVINKLKDSFVVDSIYKYKRWTGKDKINHNYYIFNRKDFETLMEQCKKGIFEYDEDDYKLQMDARYHGINCVDGCVNEIYASKVENPAALALFPVSDIEKEPYSMPDNEFKQMTHTKAFKPLKKVGEIKTIRKQNNTKTESTEKDFKTWLNEKTNKKWDVNKLKELGLTDEEIEALLNGEADGEVCSIS